MTQVDAEIVMDMLHTLRRAPAVETEALCRMEVKAGKHKPPPEGGRLGVQILRRGGGSRRMSNAGQPDQRMSFSDGHGPNRETRGW